jgi:hypothetical protein
LGRGGREFKRALELDHNYAPAHHWYSMYWRLKGRKEEALVEAQKAYDFGIHSRRLRVPTGQDPEEAGQDGQSIEQARDVDLAPDSAVTHAVLGWDTRTSGCLRRRLPSTRRHCIRRFAAEMRGLLGNAYAVSGNRTDAQRMIAELKSLWPEHARAAWTWQGDFPAWGIRKVHCTGWRRPGDAVKNLIGLGKDPHFVELRTDDASGFGAEGGRAPIDNTFANTIRYFCNTCS